VKGDSLAGWLFDKDLDVSNFDERPLKANIWAETAEAVRKLDTASSAPQATEPPLTIPTHFVRKPKSVTVFRVIFGIVFCLFAADTVLRIHNIFFSNVLFIYGPYYGLVLAAQIFGFFLLYRAFFKPIMSSAEYAIKQRLAVSAGEAVMKDPRPPAVLLRSFKSEDLKVRVRFAERQRLEEILAPLCSAVGPFIAIGKPKEKNPRLGAARDYIPDDKWQETVLKWFDAASAILVIADETPGLKWELDKLRETGNSRKVILINPQLPEDKKIDLVGIVSQLWSGQADVGKRDNVDLGPNVIMHVTGDGKLRTIRDRYERSAHKYRAALAAALSSMFLPQQPAGAVVAGVAA